ncbi:MAG: FkbM family methyltransferase [Gemmatimonadales bacterium]
MSVLHRARLRGEALLAGTVPGVYRALLRVRGRSNAMKILLAGLVRRGDVVFDVGANQGIFTAMMSNLVGRGGRVHAFEPSPETCDLLRATLAMRARTPANVVVNALAAGAEDGTATLHTPRRDHGQASLRTHDAGSWSGGAAVHSDAISITKLDTYAGAQRLARIDVVKMDIEGAELPALRGFAAGLRTFHPIVVCELCGAWTRAFDYEPAAVVDELRRAGYPEFHVVTRSGGLSPLPGASALNDGESRDIVATAGGVHAARIHRLVR